MCSLRQVPLVGLLAVLTGTLAGACGGDVGPLADDEFLSAFPSDPDHPWLLCDVVETFRSVSGVVTGGEASTLTLPRGHTLEIPATALAAGTTVQVTFRQLPTAAVAVELLPHDQVFEDSLTLTLEYGDRGCQASNAAELAVYRALPDFPHDLLPPAGAAAGAVAGRLDRFSTFAIAQ